MQETEMKVQMRRDDVVRLVLQIAMFEDIVSMNEEAEEAGAFTSHSDVPLVEQE